MPTVFIDLDRGNPTICPNELRLSAGRKEKVIFKFVGGEDGQALMLLFSPFQEESGIEIKNNTELEVRGGAHGTYTFSILKEGDPYFPGNPCIIINGD